jgi:cell division protein FtsB
VVWVKEKEGERVAGLRDKDESKRDREREKTQMVRETDFFFRVKKSKSK